MGRPSVAIVGCGWAGSRHARALEACGAPVRWLVDVDEGRAGALRAGLSDGSATSDYGRALADPELDAVVVCLPHALHASFAIAALAAGKHVLVEKPLAATPEEADRMIEAAERAGTVLMVAENERFKPLNFQAGGSLQRPRALIRSTRRASASDAGTFLSTQSRPT